MPIELKFFISFGAIAVILMLADIVLGYGYRRVREVAVFVCFIGAFFSGMWAIWS